MNNKFSFVLVLFLTFSIFSCTHSNEPELNTEVPTILVSSINKSNETVDFTIINNTNVEFYYEGWSETSPIFGFETVSDTGWVYCGPYWCGTGLQDQLLNPNQKFKITANFNEIAKFNSVRLVLDFKRSESNEWVQVTSKELELNK